MTLAHRLDMPKRMDADRTKLAVWTVVSGFRSVRSTAEQIGRGRGAKIKLQTKTRAAEILDEIGEQGTDADDGKLAAWREVEGDSRQAFEIREPSPTERRDH
jgi:hypothetical protein